MSAFKALGLDPKMYKHVKTDDKTTTLKHKQGHLVTIAHNVLSPRMQTQLKALANVGKENQTNTQAQEAQDQTKRPMAQGGFLTRNQSNQEKGVRTPAHGNPGQSYSGHAMEEAKRRPEHKEVYVNNSKHIAKENLQDLRSMPKANIKGLADGGMMPYDEVANYDEGTPDQPVSQSDIQPDYTSQLAPPKEEYTSHAPEVKEEHPPIPEHLKEAVKEPGMWDKISKFVKDSTQDSLNPTAPGAQTLPQAVGLAPAGSVLADQQPDTNTPAPPQPDKMQEASAVQAVQQDPNVPAPVKAAPAPVEQTFQDHKQASLNEMTAEDKAWQHDLNNGHITPKTYQDLFHDKGTLGKIGTIFGMLLSGAGSGLSHQPNAMFALMDKQIQNDLEAQKTSKANAQNFLRINQQQGLNKANIANTNQDTDLKHYTLTKIQMNQAALHKLTLDAKKLPPGSPQRAQADQTLAMMNGAVQNDNFNLADRAATAEAFQKMVLGGDNTANAASEIRKKQLVGAMTPEQASKALEEVGRTENHININKNALDSFDQVAKLATINGKVHNPIQNIKRINAEWDPMMDKLTKDTEGRVTPITVEMMSSLKPTLTDNAKTLEIKRGKLIAILNAGMATPTLDSFNIRVNKGERAPQSSNKSPQAAEQWANANLVGPNAEKARKILKQLGK